MLDENKAAFLRRHYPVQVQGVRRVPSQPSRKKGSPRATVTIRQKQQTVNRFCNPAVPSVGYGNSLLIKKKTSVLFMVVVSVVRLENCSP
jgi:hypothetical protein